MDDLKPINCKISGDNDNTDDIGAFPDQPPLFVIHGTQDATVPYVNGKAAYERAQSVGLASTMITIEGTGHRVWNDFLTNYFTDLTTSLYQEVTKGAQTLEGCHDED